MYWKAGLLMIAVMAAPVLALGGQAAKLPAEAEDNIMGEFVGTFKPAKGELQKAEAKVIALGKERYSVVFLMPPLAPWKEQKRIELKGEATGAAAAAIGGTVDGVSWKGRLNKNQLEAAGEGVGVFEMKRGERKSPTLLQKPPPGAVVVLPYKKNTPPSLAEWRNDNWKPMPDGSMLVGRRNNLTVKEFGDIKLHMEFRIPFQPNARGQGRGNSGIYFQDRYEIQILDSFGLVPQMGDCGSIYSIAITPINACLPPKQWQTYDVEFRAPRFGDDGKVVKPAHLTVMHNGIKTHVKQDATHPTTAAGSTGAAPKGPIMLQDHGQPTRYRNIWVVELKE